MADDQMQTVAQLQAELRARSNIESREGDRLRQVAQINSVARAVEISSLSGYRSNVRALLECRTIHITDRSDPAVLAEFPDNKTSRRCRR